MSVRLCLLSFTILFLAACQVEDGATEATPGATSVVTESTGPEDISLPFDNPFPNRWNPSNDGTSFEPCVAYSDDELLRFGVDPSVIEDAAIVDGQGIRGCDWFMPRQFTLSSVVTDSTSLEHYKAGARELDWKADLVVGGRIVGQAQLNDDERTCKTYVQSYESVIVTSVVIASGSGPRANYDPCQMVVDFTTAYIDKIPE